MELIGKNDPKLLYYKGKILKMQKMSGDAMLTMEQLVGVDEEAWSIKALYFIAKIRVKEKNFYEAYHTLNRLPIVEEDTKIAVFKKLIEGVMGTI